MKQSGKYPQIYYQALEVFETKNIGLLGNWIFNT